MKEEYLNSLNKARSNLNILPHETKTEIKKYLEYIQKNETKYEGELELIKAEIKKRYDKITNIEVKKLKDVDIDYSIIKILNKQSSSYVKMSLDINLYKLKRFYNGNLTEVNTIILDIIESFKKVNIALTINDFIYTNFVTEYMKVLLTNSNNLTKIYAVFEQIYWKCPEVITQITLNFNHLYYKYEKKINNFYLKEYQNQNINDYLDNYKRNILENDNIKHHDAKYFIDLFLNKELVINEFKQVNINKTMSELVIDKNDSKLYDNLLNLLNSLKEYSLYLNYDFIIKDIIELYKNKSSYKNQYTNKLKEINKKEKMLFKFNNKYKRLKDNKKEIIGLKINNTIQELVTFYNDLDDLRITNDLYLYVNDETNYLQLFLIAQNNYNYLASLFKGQDENISLDAIDQKYEEFLMFLAQNNLDIISHVSVLEEKNIPQIIADRYVLLNFNLKEDDLSIDNIEATIKMVENLVYSLDLNKLNLTIDNLDFIFEVKKNNLI